MQRPSDVAVEYALQAYATSVRARVSLRGSVRAAIIAASPFLIGENDTTDGYHTFGELYRHRMLLTAALFTDWWRADRDKVRPGFQVHKSWRHSDGAACFDGGWFIVMATLPTGQISYHYPAKDWDLFDVREQFFADEWDGHTAADVADRLAAFLQWG